MHRDPLTATLIAIVLLSACAPPPRASGPPPGDQAPPRVAAPAQGTPKTLTVLVQREPNGWGSLAQTGSSSASSGGSRSVEFIAQDLLTAEIDLDTFVPLLGEALPSVDLGTWVLHADGTMDVTWRLRPNIKWHDGTPFSSADLLFSFTVFMDPELPTTASQRAAIQSATAPDPQTFVVRYKHPYVNANRGELGDIYPRHLLEELYQTDKLALQTTPWLNSDFVGLGPYRLNRWDRGSSMEFTGFADYYQGPPKLGRIVVRFINDPNAMVAAILAGDVDVVLPVAVDLEAALEVKRRWEGTGNQVRTDITGRMPHLEMQYRPDVARPREGFTNRAVRQAFYHAIDRQTLTDIMNRGLAPVADSWYHPAFPDRGQLEPAIPQFPFDPTRAQQILVQAGWTRGSDGILVNAATGDRFETELWGLSGQGFGLERQLNIVADGWKTIGAQVQLTVVPPARVSDAEYVTFHPGPLFTNPSGERFYTDRLSSKYIPSAANRWTGFDRGAYINPKVDALYDRLNTTIDPRDRMPLHRELLQEQMGDVALMPLYWEVVPTLMLKGVSGPKHVRNDSTRNIFDWDKL